MVAARKDILGGDGSGDGVWVHCISRCVRRAFLCGDGLDHRKGWVEDRLRLLAECAAVEVAGYAVMSNHLHVVLRVRSDVAAGWTDQEVARRWLTLWPKNRRADGAVLAPSKDQIEEAVRSPMLAKWRERLANLGWCLKALKEDISRRANKEDTCSGAFWESRYKSVPLLDQAALIACMAYVDLNPIRARLVDRPERSAHTGARTRIRARQGFLAARRLAEKDSEKSRETARKCGLRETPRHLEDGLWLTPIAGCIAGKPGAVETPRSSGLSAEEYLTLLDGTGRLLREGKRGAIPKDLLPILKRLDIELDAWLATMQGWQEFLGRVVGAAAARVAAAGQLGLRWVQNRCALFRPAKDEVNAA